MLLTRSPLIFRSKLLASFDLHVLSTPPAFVLSQDQTLQQKRGQKRQRKSDEHPTQQTLNEASSCMWPSAIKAEQTRPITRTTDIHVATGKKPTAKLTDNLNQHPKRDTDRTARTGVLSSLPFSRSRSPEHAQPRNKTPTPALIPSAPPTAKTPEKRRATLTPPKQRSNLTHELLSETGRLTELNVIGGR